MPWLLEFQLFRLSLSAWISRSRISEAITELLTLAIRPSIEKSLGNIALISSSIFILFD